jgi:predicted nuclease of restriction endonuclease-like (RecB) superfamily
MKSEVHSLNFGIWISDLKLRIHEARRKVAFSINSQLLELYWEIGREICEKQEKAAWGSNLIEQVADELKMEFPDVKGFSRRNLFAIRQWYRFYCQKYQFVPQLVAQIPWGHNRLIITKIKNIAEAEFYCLETIRNAWDRDTLEIQIAKNLYDRSNYARHNFASTLPESKSTLLSQTLKDPYIFDFLSVEDEMLEKTIEDELTKHITAFLLELGKGFAFLGRQYKIEISDTDYYIDMLFYHVELRCYVVVELKAGKFKPEHAGKLNFYLSAVDAQLKRFDDEPSIGILLCKHKDKVEVDYALRDINKPIGISEYLLTDSIPEKLQAKLPSIEQLENDLCNNHHVKSKT